MATQVQVLRAQVQAMLQGLKETPSQDKKNHVSTHAAQRYNKLLEGVKAAAGGVAASLPSEIGTSALFSHMGKTEALYVDLEMNLRELDSLLEIAASDGA